MYNMENVGGETFSPFLIMLELKLDGRQIGIDKKEVFMEHVKL